jgi:hypothetical protein
MRLAGTAFCARPVTQGQPDTLSFAAVFLIPEHFTLKIATTAPIVVPDALSFLNLVGLVQRWMEKEHDKYRDIRFTTRRRVQCSGALSDVAGDAFARIGRR